MSARRLALTLAAIALALAPAPAAYAMPATPPPRASLTDIENDVMCVSCREPLAVAESPQAYAERAYIRSLINQGMTKPQIERELVAQYGPAVLGKPPAHGFNLTVYVLPPAILIGGLIVLAVVLPRWRRRTKDHATDASSPPQLDPLESQRLDAELSHWRG
jgi:cytochrome c-type biogenesis protein CcmH